MQLLVAVDHALARELNGLTRRSRAVSQAVAAGATGLAATEIALMVLLGLGGRWRASLRMLAAVAAVYALVEGVGRTWRRTRPFVRLDPVKELVDHAPHRSFPSRHVAAAVAMATIARPASAPISRLMRAAAWGLAVTRVAAGLHYPSDIAAGAALGLLVGRLFRG